MNTPEEPKLQSIQKPDHIDLNHFFHLIANPNETSKNIEALKELFKEYYIFNSTQYNCLNKLYSNFFSEKNNQIFSNTPIYQVESAFQKLIQFQLKVFESISKKIVEFNQIENYLTSLEKLVSDISPKFKHFSFHEDIYNETNSVFQSVMQTMSELETKIVDEYISEKYNKHILGVSDKSVDELVLQINNLEKRVFNNVQEKKNKYYLKIKESYDKIQSIYNNIKTNSCNYIVHIKELINNYIKQLDDLINEMNSNISNEKIKTNENTIISKSEFELNEKDFFSVKYKIKILKNAQLILKGPENVPNEKQEKPEKQEKNKKAKSEKYIMRTKEDLAMAKKKFEDENLFLTEKDIFEIITKLYSYDLKIIDKSYYDLNLEKGKLIAMDITNNILIYSEDNDDSKNKLNEDYNEIMESINTKIVNNIKNIESFLLVLNNYRATGKIIFNEKFFDIVVYIYNKAQDILIKNSNRKIEDLMIILSQTYYKKVDNNKIYLCEIIKSHDLYKNNEFWKALIITKIEEEMKYYRNINPSNILSKDKREDIICNKLISFSEIIKDFDYSEDQMVDLFQKIFDKYKYREASRNKLLSFFNKKKLNNK